MKKLFSVILCTSMVASLVAIRRRSEAGQCGERWFRSQRKVPLRWLHWKPGYGAAMWGEVCEAFTAETGIKVNLTTDKNLEDVIGAAMQGGEFPDVVHLATGRPAGLTEQFIKGNID